MTSSLFIHEDMIFLEKELNDFEKYRGNSAHLYLEQGS